MAAFFETLKHRAPRTGSDPQGIWIPTKTNEYLCFQK